MKNKIKIAILIVTIFFSLINYVYAITLKEAIDKALSTSDQARLIQESKSYSYAQANKVDAFTKPRVDTSIKYYELGTTADDSPFMPTPDRQMVTGLTASKLLWSGDKINQIRALKESLMGLAQIEEVSMRRELSKEVSNDFLAFLYQQARIDVLKDRVKQREDELSDATDLFEAGMVTNLDVREAKLQLHVAEDSLRSGESDLHTALVDFNLAIGESAQEEAKTLLMPDGALTRPQNLNEQLLTLENLYKDKKQLDIKRANQALNISKTNLNLAKDESKPAISLVAGTEYGGEKVDDFEASWSLGAQLTWNFYDGGTIDAGIASALAQKNSSEASLNKTQKAISGALNKLKREVESLNKRIKLQEDTVSLSHGNYEDARGLYLTGTMTLTRLGDFNLLYAEARFNLLQLYYLENIISIEIASLIGDVI
ncbi:MAG: TolC family protein [Desulfamplus sp.]|nr:TolC family protein [Desulfamplus sp.]